MRLYEKRRRRKRRQRIVISSIFAIGALSLAFLSLSSVKTQNGAPGETTELSSEVIGTDPSSAETSETTQASVYPAFSYSKDWDAEESYLLAKVAMTEAESESVKGKELVIMVVLNRVASDEFPDTIKEVIFQKNQFKSVSNGRWNKVEPDADCWAAVEAVMQAKYDYSEGALYFESCKNSDDWHSKNLEFLYQFENHKFYK